MAVSAPDNNTILVSVRVVSVSDTRRNHTQINHSLTESLHHRERERERERMASPGRFSDESGSDDDRILTYGDSTLIRSDLAILRGPHYLNDRLIHFFFSHLAASCSFPDDILLVPPSIAYLIANYPDPAFLSDVVLPLDLPHKALVLFPINDNPDVTRAEGGSHWSLLVCHVPSQEFVHHDSSRGLNSNHARRLYGMVKSFLGGVNFGYHEGPTPQQTNGYDCGLYVMAIARCVCEWYCRVKNNPSVDGKEKWFDLLSQQLYRDKVHELRGELLSLVLRLTQQSDSKNCGI